MLLGTAEVGLRLILGPPDPPILVAPHWQGEEPAFAEQQGLVTPVYQRVNHETPFPIAPQDGRPRVFVLGGSSVHGGSQLDKELEFPSMLASLLHDGGHDVEVLNLGKPSLDSHSIRLISDQALTYQPDLLVLYLGHNDLGNTTMESRYRGIQGALEARTQVLLRRLKLYEVLVASAVKTLPPVQGPADDRWTSPPLDEPQRLLAAASLQDNLAHIAHTAADAEAEVIMVTPISELSQQTPLGALCPEHTHLTRRGGSLEKVAEAIDAVLEAQPDCPILLYTRGSRRLQAGHPGACEDLRRANDLDPRPVTASEDMADAIRAAARSSGAALVDLRAQVLGEHCVPPPSWFEDSVHFSELGHQQVAAILSPAVESALETYTER